MTQLDPMIDVIEDAVQDASTPEVDVTPEVSVDAVDSGSEEVTTSPDASVDTPLNQEESTIQDEFEKRWGIPARSVTGRENRIPHARVKQMVTKAETEALSKAKKELEGQFTPKIAEFETKVKSYEERLGRVAQFEQILENDPKTFLQMLSQIPAYKEFFEYIGQLANGQKQQVQPESIISRDGAPPPDGPDGLYTSDGLHARDEWLAKQIEARAVAQAETKLAQRYAPIEQEWQRQQRLAQITPVIEQQITEARQWPNFAELETDIVAALNSDKRMSLERAYLKSYQDKIVPKMAADRNKIRSEVLAEIQKKPISSSAPVQQVKPNTAPAAGRTMEQIIADELKSQGLM